MLKEPVPESIHCLKFSGKRSIKFAISLRRYVGIEQEANVILMACHMWRGGGAEEVWSNCGQKPFTIVLAIRQPITRLLALRSGTRGGHRQCFGDTMYTPIGVSDLGGRILKWPKTDEKL